MDPSTYVFVAAWKIIAALAALAGLLALLLARPARG